MRRFTRTLAFQKALNELLTIFVEMRRRFVIASVGAATIGALSGCVSAVNAIFEVDNGGKLERDPPSLPLALECTKESSELFPEFSNEKIVEGDLRRLPPQEDISFGHYDDWKLEINQQTFEYGEIAEFNLVLNSRSDETGPGAAWRIDLLTQDGWQDVRKVLWPYGGPRTLPAVNHDAGLAFEWDVKLTEDGIIAAYGRQATGESVCPTLETGRYRFVYSGIGGSGEGIGIEFDLYT